MHQAASAMVLSESVELITTINVAAVFVRLMVLAVIGSHLSIFGMSYTLEINRESQTYARIPKVMRTISNPTESTTRALSNNMTVGTMPAVTNFCASLSDCDARN